MNKKLAVAVWLACMPLTLTAAGTTHNVTKNDLILPVDLDLAATRYDIVLPEQPVTMTADSVLARNSDGYIQGRGNVDMYQGTDEIHANYVEGNKNTQLYYIPGEAVLLQGDTALNGTGVIYNGKTHGGTMDTMAGFISPTTYVRGTDGETYAGEGYLKHGLITTPHAVAQTPDYYITGDDIHIYPGVKYTAENTKLWFKHLCVLTYGHYEGRLDNVSRNSYLFTLFPRPTYNKDDGFGVKGDATFPMSKDGSLYLYTAYEEHTKSGFKPTAELVKESKYGRFSFGYSTEESTDNDKHIWARKFPELQYTMPRLYIGKSPLYVDHKMSWGRWQEDYTGTGTHKGFRTELSHNPLPLWKMANIRYFIGYRKDLYEINDAMIRDPYNGVIFHQGINDHLWTDIWLYKHNISGSTPYRFDTIDNPRQKGISVGYTMTPRDTFIFSVDRDLDTHEIADRNFTWLRDLHSFTGSLTYKSVENSWEFHVVAKDF